MLIAAAAVTPKPGDILEDLEAHSKSNQKSNIDLENLNTAPKEINEFLTKTNKWEFIPVCYIRQDTKIKVCLSPFKVKTSILDININTGNKNVLCEQDMEIHSNLF